MIIKDLQQVIAKEKSNKENMYKNGYIVHLITDTNTFTFKLTSALLIFTDITGGVFLVFN